MVYKILTVGAGGFIGTDFEKASDELSKLVNHEISQGWKPIGGVAVGETQSTQEPYLFQSLIKE